MAARGRSPGRHALEIALEIALDVASRCAADDREECGCAQSGELRAKHQARLGWTRAGRAQSRAWGASVEGSQRQRLPTPAATRAAGAGEGVASA
jgi:hypothetical protein